MIFRWHLSCKRVTSISITILAIGREKNPSHLNKFSRTTMTNLDTILGRLSRFRAALRVAYDAELPELNEAWDKVTEIDGEIFNHSPQWFRDDIISELFDYDPETMTEIHTLLQIAETSEIDDCLSRLAASNAAFASPLVDRYITRQRYHDNLAAADRDVRDREPSWFQHFADELSYDYEGPGDLSYLSGDPGFKVEVSTMLQIAAACNI